MDFGSVELKMLAWAIVLGLIQMLLAVLGVIFGGGMAWAMGPRDTAAPELPPIAARLDRAFRNFLETFPFFAAAVLLVTAMGKQTHMSALGAELYFWARLAYVPVYAISIPLTRTLVWAVSLVGILMVVAAIFVIG